ncbi:F0F1 ATP synthase subunit B [Nitrosovibrio tenuis]|uniref:ATP synthase subunit b n=1 Tax=Nitrosovibrio tenuis TaxID=1233 RepID=A0A1H7I249_9PROT|nr:F0F1 ATP synthase subunit B [Nitrosovibrio tenuis]SEK56626.1 ATP synthase F0 subcomplex B subunit [Nitrosovibrio tenuis]
MLIDWFTVIAQAVNFLILVWLLKRLLYQPILEALDARERRIAAELADANAKKMEAEKERHVFQQKNDEFDLQRAELLRKAVDEARAERGRLIAAARQDAQELRAKWERALKLEYHNLSQAIARQTCAEVFAIARRVLADLANTTLEAHMVEAFIKRLRKLGHEEKVQLTSAVRMPALVTSVAAGDEKLVPGIMVRSVFELSAAQQSMIESVLKEILGGEVPFEVPVRFAAKPDLISGIEVVMNGYKLAWHVADYLASMEKEIEEVLKTHFQPESESELKSQAEDKA